MTKGTPETSSAVLNTLKQNTTGSDFFSYCLHYAKNTQANVFQIYKCGKIYAENMKIKYVSIFFESCKVCIPQEEQIKVVYSFICLFINTYLTSFLGMLTSQYKS